MYVVYMSRYWEEKYYIVRNYELFVQVLANQWHRVLSALSLQAVIGIFPSMKAMWKVIRLR